MARLWLHDNHKPQPVPGAGIGLGLWLLCNHSPQSSCWQVQSKMLVKHYQKQECIPEGFVQQTSVAISMGGICLRGCVCPGGVCTPAHCMLGYTPPCEQNDRTGVRTLPCPKLHLWMVVINSACQSMDDKVGVEPKIALDTGLLLRI